MQTDNQHLAQCSQHNFYSPTLSVKISRQ